MVAVLNPDFSFLDTFRGYFFSSAGSGQPNLEVVSKADKVAQNVVKDNGDFVLTPVRTAAYCFVDTLGGIRQMAESTQAIALLTHTASAVAHVAGTVTPFALLITGPCVLITGSTWILPDGYKALSDAKKEREEAPTPEAQKEAKNGIAMAQLGLANQWLMMGMGAAQTAVGAVAMSTPVVAKVLHYAPLLKGAAAFTANAVAGVALGTAYFLRGNVMLYRTVKSYRHVRDFRKEFNSSLKGGVKTAMAFMQKKEAISPTYLNRRVEASCLYDKGTVSEVSRKSDAEKIEYLKQVDKGIYTQELKHQVSIIIAGAMIFGGALAIVLSILTGGAPIAIAMALASAVFFMSMEYLFLTYDSTKAFEWLRDRLYRESINIQP